MKNLRVFDPILRAKLCERLRTAGFNAVENDEFVGIRYNPVNYLILSEVLSSDGKFTEFQYKPAPNEAAHSLQHNTAERIAAIILDASKANKDFFEFVRRLILKCDAKDLNEVIRSVIGPQFQERFPKGTIHFLSFNDLLLKREGTTRLLMTAMHLPEVLDVKNRDQFQGFSSMRSLQSPVISYSLDAYLNLILLIFEPDSYGIVCNRVTGSFIFLFGDSYQLLDYIPPTFSYHYYSTDILNTFKGSPDEKRKLYKGKKWDADTFKDLF